MNILGACFFIWDLYAPKSKETQAENMTIAKPEQMLLEAIKAAVRDEQIDWEEPIEEEDWTQFMRLTQNHKLLPLAYQAVYSCEAVRDMDSFSVYKRMTVMQVAEQTVKTNEFLTFYDSMQKAGFHPLIVKGVVCRNLYSNPDARISTDEDLLIPETEFVLCCNWMKENGMESLGEYSENDFEVGWRGVNNNLYIELHRSLFSLESKAVSSLNSFFDAAHENAMDYTVEGGVQIRSMCPHDHFLYLILHSYKHFINSGFGIRQICDIGMWAKRYTSQIDWDRLYTQCESVRALNFAAAVFQIARLWLDIKWIMPDKWRDIRVDSMPMLQDSLSGGIFGAVDRTRLHSSTLTLNEVAAQREGKRGSVWTTIFPSRQSMKNRYPQVDKYPVLLPVFWIARIVKYGKETMSTADNSASGSLALGKKRKELMKQYGIID